LITLGADPELFLTKKGIPTSAHGLIPGNKKTPFSVHRGAVQVDGMALEINIFPTDTPKKFTHNINTVLSILRSMVPKEYSFDFSSSINFSTEEMSKQPSSATQLGCEPDFNAWEMTENPIPPIHANMRTASGNLHIGFEGRRIYEYDLDHFYRCCNLVKQLDVTLGITSLLVDKDTERRSMYGRAGAFRPKNYPGVEYRVLSNFWLSSKELTEQLAIITLDTIENIEKGRDYVMEIENLGMHPVNIINNGDIESAEYVITKLELKRWNNEK